MKGTNRKIGTIRGLAAFAVIGMLLAIAVSFVPAASAEIVRRDFYFHGGDLGGSGFGAIYVQGTMDESIGSSERIALVSSYTNNVIEIAMGGLEDPPADTSAYAISFTSEALAEDLVICPGLKTAQDTDGADWSVASHISVFNYIQCFDTGVWGCGIYELKAEGTYVPVAYCPQKVFGSCSLSDFAEGVYPVAYVAGPEATTYTFAKGSKIAIGISPCAFAGAVEAGFAYDSDIHAARLRFNTVVGEMGSIVMNTTNPEKSVHAGERIIYAINLTNTCGLDQSVVLKKTDAPPGWEAALSDTKFDLKANESKDITLSINASLDSIEGDEAKIAVRAIYEFGTSFLNTTTKIVNFTIDTSNQDVLPQQSGEADSGKVPGFEILGLMGAICAAVLISRRGKI